ncbi:hypothetical protein C8F04DRAFT_88693 [Mycena alexandri]|uniref:F-box domain-containing protein n=1 Tax=Mycena alexandri TaxID=1745969 RepID=A0AAD6WY16_9AGAR|nr:hypothetical protein C8F04DRAFT_88693 [Mycena alexandri]
MTGDNPLQQDHGCWLGLPLEIFQSILSLGFGFYFANRDGFIRTRTSAMGVCRSWNDLIVTSGQFWACYSPNTDKLFHEVDLWSSRFGSSLTDFRISFDTDHLVRRGRTTVEDLASFVALHAHRMRSLYFDVEDDYFLPLVASSLIRARAPHLRVLVFHRSARFFTTRPRQQFPPAFCSFDGIPDLRVLKLTDFSFTWRHPSLFFRLTTLVISKLSPDMVPTPKGLRTALVSAPLLTLFSVRRVASRRGAEPLAPFVLPFLRELDLCFCGEQGIAAVLSVCHLPSLVVVSIAFQSPADLDMLLECPQILAVARQFHGSGLLYSSSRKPELFGTLLSVNNVYIFDGGRALFEGLGFAGSDASNSACPAMSSITVSNISFREIHGFLTS